MTEPRPARVGLIVNPIAGMGGRVGLKGTDGEGTLARARELGAVPVAPERAAAVVDDLRDRPGIELEWREPDSAAGTRSTAARMADAGVDLILFVGGDGTARDLAEAVQFEVPVLGVPSGVKMHSAVFATSPASAVAATTAWLATADRLTREAELVDVDEAALRADRMEVRFYGTVRVPDVPGRLQALKAAGTPGEPAELLALAVEVLQRVAPGTVLLLGPGTTTRAIATELGVDGSLLGIDVIEAGGGLGREIGRLLVRDANEAAILAAIAGRSAMAVVSPTGGQGFLLGRGNQQLSPAVLRAVGPEHILVVATPSKLAALAAGNLYVDTGDGALDEAFAGYRRVITGPGHESVVRIVAA